jgi:hypothetical protein
MNMSESELLGIRYDRNADDMANPYTIRERNRFCTGNIFFDKKIGWRGWNIPLNGTRLEQGGASGWEVDRVVDATLPAVNVLAEDVAGKGAQLVYYDRHPAKSFVLSAGSLRFGGSLIVDGDLQTIVSNALADRRVRLVSHVGLGESTTDGPALAFHDGRIFIAWKSHGSKHLKMTLSGDGGATFGPVYTSSETSDAGPSLASHNGRLFIAWKGVGDQYLNVAKVSLFASTAGNFGIEGIEENVTLTDSSSHTPALASHDGRLFIAWKGSSDNNLNVMFSSDNGATFHGKHISTETSDSGPALLSHNNELFISWKGMGDGYLNLAKVGLLGSTAGFFGIDKVEGNVTLNETSDNGPALASSGSLFLSWTGSGDDRLNVLLSSDGGQNFWGKGIALSYESDCAPALVAADRVCIAWKDKETDELQFAVVRI